MKHKVIIWPIYKWYWITLSGPRVPSNTGPLP